jgi:hypothetical protein
MSIKAQVGQKMLNLDPTLNWSCAQVWPFLFLPFELLSSLRKAQMEQKKLNFNFAPIWKSN